MGGSCFCNHQCTGRLFVQSVDDSRPEFSTDTFEVGEVIEECIYQRAGSVTRCGMNHDSRLLVHYDKMVVLVKNVDCNRFGFERCRRGKWDTTVNVVTGPYPVSRLLYFTMDPDVAAAYQACCCRSGRNSYPGCDEYVETLA